MLLKQHNIFARCIVHPEHRNSHLTRFLTLKSVTWNYSVALATEFFFAPSQRNNALFECDNAMFCCVTCATEHFSPNFESSIPQASRIWRVRRCLVGMHRCAFSLRWVDCEQADQSQHGRDGHDPFFCDTKSNFKGTLVLHPSRWKGRAESQTFPGPILDC